MSKTKDGIGGGIDGGIGSGKHNNGHFPLLYYPGLFHVLFFESLMLFCCCFSFSFCFSFLCCAKASGMKHLRGLPIRLAAPGPWGCRFARN